MWRGAADWRAFDGGDAMIIAGDATVKLVLYPIAIHYKGSGFYTTDYGKGKAAKKDGEGGSSGGESGKTDSKPAEKKAATGGD